MGLGLGVFLGCLGLAPTPPSVCKGGRYMGEGVQLGVGRAFSPTNIKYLGLEPLGDVGVTKGELFWLVIIG